MEEACNDPQSVAYMTPQEVAARLRLSVRAVYDRIATGELTALNVGTPARAQWRIEERELERYVRDHTTGGNGEEP